MTCSIEGCKGKHKARGWCNTHYKRWRQYGDPQAPDRRFTDNVCSVEDCEDRVRSRGFCRVHYDRWVKGHAMEGRPEPIRRCQMSGCWNSHHTKGLCQKHYRRWLRYDGDPWFDGRNYPECKIEGCYKPRHAFGMCPRHYGRFRDHGDPLAFEKDKGMGVALPYRPVAEVIVAHDPIGYARGLPGGFSVLMARAGLDAAEVDRVEKYLDRARKRGEIDLAYADHFAVKVLGTHPALIWGDDYWAAEAHEHEEVQAA